MGKPLGEMTPDERAATIRRATDRFQQELTAAAPAISAILDQIEQPEFFAVTITFKMDAASRAAYAREYSIGAGDSAETWRADPSKAGADIREHAAEHVKAAIGQDYMLSQFTQFSVSDPA